jgi:chaperonin GroES
MSQTILPLGDRVLVLETKKEALPKTAGGLILPETHTHEDVKTGTVIQVGPGLYTQAGKLIPMTVKVGDEVLIPPYGNGQNIKLDSIQYVLYRESDLIGVMKPQKNTERQLEINFVN